jgi:hypothetical protein
MSIITKYKQTRDWILGALIEKIEGHVDVMDHRLTVDCNSSGKEEWYWKKQLILECEFSHHTIDDGNGGLQHNFEGYFNVPSNLNDEYITKRVENWTR